MMAVRPLPERVVVQCWNCNAENDEGYSTCWFCKEPAHPSAGVEGRLPSAPADEDPGRTRHVVHRTHTVQRHTARSLEELPPEVRERIRQMQADPSAAGAHSTYTYRGPDGRTQTFSSLDEMPPDVRAAFEHGPANLGRQTLASRRMERTERVPRVGTSEMADGDAFSANPPGNTFAFWAGGVLAAGFLIGLGLAALISMPLASTSGTPPGFLGIQMPNAVRSVVGVGCVVVGGLLHVCLFWVTAARRQRRFHAMRLFLTCVVAAFLLGNLHLLTTLVEAYRIE